MKKNALILIVSLICLLGSCSSNDEVKSSENYIEEFKIAGITAEIKNNINQIYILVFEEDYEDILNAEPSQIKCSKNATLSNSSGKWTENGFTYTVTAENGDTRNYTVYIGIVHKKYSFESWVLSDSTEGYYIPSDSNSSWSSGNEGIKMALQILPGRDHKNRKSYPTKDTVDIYGNAVLLETLEGGDVFGRKIPLLSGNLIFGNFNASKAITDELSATELGRNYPAKPKSIKGFYKYKEGPGTFMNNGAEVPGRRDTCTIKAEFYRSDSDTDRSDITLNVRTIEGSDLIIATANLKSCVETAGDEFYPFEVEFGAYREEPDFRNHRYKLAITFAASRDGGTYAGKIGSKLIIDEVEFVDY